MSKPKQRKKAETLAEAIGEENILPFIEHTYHGRSLSEISKLMPEVFSTKGAVAGIRYRHLEEIATLLAALMVTHGPPAEVGRSKPFSGTPHKRGKPPETIAPQPPPEGPAKLVPTAFEEDLIIASALAEWQPAFGRNPYGYAALCLNRARSAETGLRSAHDIARHILESAGGRLAEFLTKALQPTRRSDRERIREAANRIGGAMHLLGKEAHQKLKLEQKDE